MTYYYGLNDKLLHITLKAVLKVWTTTLALDLHRDKGIPLTRILLKGNRLRLTARLNSLDDCHHVTTRDNLCLSVGTVKFRAKPRNK